METDDRPARFPSGSMPERAAAGRSDLLRQSGQSNLLRFDIEADGQTMPCRISCAAIEELSGSRCFGKAGLHARYNSHRTAIEALARRKFQAGRTSIYGGIDLWATDVTDDAAGRNGATDGSPAQPGSPARKGKAG
ncbi:conserved protein of unknown function [Rhodovastum atsumiense]|uniref:DUF1488 domain-containing protein n=1 Tax=Rhodovastum atsumiense TaxID=504468 RepID=A0A5M6IWR1_9PROT|nr:DUF1488 family protein [Rhodovastum atsumiense]KAA5612287.1 DUF1488 domain-containing protein [Rhodovastum atsumiense]CAH2601618.1 conserved protein of unknown function [Rhodovastum atsumiense]